MYLILLYDHIPRLNKEWKAIEFEMPLKILMYMDKIRQQASGKLEMN